MRDRAITRLAAVLRPGSRWLAPALAAVAVGIAGCGSDDDGTIPPASADAMIERLDQIESAVESQDCTSARTDVSQLSGTVNLLPKEVGTETKDDLRTLVTRLENLLVEQCTDSDSGTSTEPDTGATGVGGEQ